MSRTNIDLDDEAVAEVMRRFALDQVRRRPLPKAGVDALGGTGWGDNGLELSDLRPGFQPFDE